MGAAPDPAGRWMAIGGGLLFWLSGVLSLTITTGGCRTSTCAAPTRQTVKKRGSPLVILTLGLVPAPGINHHWKKPNSGVRT